MPKKEKKGKVRVIDINAGTQKELKVLMLQAQDIQDKIHLIARVYADAIGEQGAYTLSSDCTKLVFADN